MTKSLTKMVVIKLLSDSQRKLKKLFIYRAAVCTDHSFLLSVHMPVCVYFSVFVSTSHMKPNLTFFTYFIKLHLHSFKAYLDRISQFSLFWSNSPYLESESPGISGITDSFRWGEVGWRGEPPGAGEGTSSPSSPPLPRNPELDMVYVRAALSNGDVA